MFVNVWESAVFIVSAKGYCETEANVEHTRTAPTTKHKGEKKQCQQANMNIEHARNICEADIS